MKVLFASIFIVLSLMFTITALAMPPPEVGHHALDQDKVMMLTTDIALQKLSPGGGSKVFRDSARPDTLAVSPVPRERFVSGIPIYDDLSGSVDWLLMSMAGATEDDTDAWYYEYKPIPIRTAGKKGTKPRPVKPTPRYIGT